MLWKWCAKAVGETLKGFPFIRVPHSRSPPTILKTPPTPISSRVWSQWLFRVLSFQFALSFALILLLCALLLLFSPPFSAFPFPNCNCNCGLEWVAGIRKRGCVCVMAGCGCPSPPPPLIVLSSNSYCHCANKICHESPTPRTLPFGSTPKNRNTPLLSVCVYLTFVPIVVLCAGLTGLTMRANVLVAYEHQEMRIAFI